MYGIKQGLCLKQIISNLIRINNKHKTKIIASTESSNYKISIQ